MDATIMDRHRGSHSRVRLRVGGFVAALLALAAIGPSTALADPPDPGAYQEDDGGGFRNIVPPGQNGVANFDEVLQFLIDGTRPEHNADQLDEYDGLVYQSPGSISVTDNYFKDASFGVQASDTGAVEYTPDCGIVSAPSASSPHCDDVTIVRDSAYGVPHIYGADRPAAMFAAGYVGAEDRLFFMDVERHLGRADLSSFLGGSNASTDASIWRQAPYTEAELQAQYDNVDEFQGADGALVQEDVQNYADGINQYIAEARLDSAMMPGEYQLALGDTDGPDPWQVTDIVATASLVAGQFGKGGGAEVGSALVLEKAVDKFGDADGHAVWEDFRSGNDPEAPLTVHDGTDFPYGLPPASPLDQALPDPGTTQAEPLVESPAKVKAAKPPAFKGLLDLQGASNALLISDAESEGDHPVAVMGPQVGYYSPQILTEIDIHAPTTPAGPGVDARGVGFAGINMYVLLGRGQDYAWSATSAGQDITDTYAVQLCDPENPEDPGSIDDDGYLFDGNCEPFEVLERVNSWEPNTADPTPAGTQTLHALRTKLGIVTHRAMIDGTPVAYTQLRATYMHEADSAVGFANFNNPDTMESPAEFEAAASKIDYTFNWFYADPDHVAYFNSGANPVRPANVDPNLPVEGQPDDLWEGFDPDTVTFDRAPAAEHPQVVDQDYISSWNNKQAIDYSASDDTWSYGPVHRVDSLDERIEAGIADADTMSRNELVDAMESAATVDLRGSQVLPEALRVVKPDLGKLKDGKKLKKAVKNLQAWSDDGAHRLDADADGAYDDGKAVRIMDAWWPRLVKAEFKPTLGGALYGQIQSMIGLDDPPAAGGSAYISGWYGYVDKDLRTILGDSVDGPYSRTYCGNGSLKQCRKDLQKSLSKALKHDSAKDLHPGFPNDACEELDPVPTAQWCHDSIRATAIGAITQPPIHWQNRPTFQQAVEPQNDVP
jgi:acyl-homoserine lactone acylase PvdQ